MLHTKQKGIVIQIRSQDNHTSKAMTIYNEDIMVAFARIQHLYESLGNNKEVTITHKNDKTIN